MANLTLCSAVKEEGSQRSRATNMMRASCAHHLRATVGILKPTLVISQGVRLHETLWAALGVTREVNPNLAYCDVNGNQFVWASLRHPTLSWHSLEYPYMSEIVIPTIKAARKRALKLAQTG